MFPREAPARWLTWAHLALTVVVWWIPIATYSSLPDQIAVHFDASGLPNRFASKSGWSLWAVPSIAALIGLGILILSRFPGLSHFPRKDEVNGWPLNMREPVYAVIREMLLAVLICLDVMWMLIEYRIVMGARTGYLASPWVAVLVPALAPLAFLVYYLNRISRTIDVTKAEAAR